MIHTLTKQIIDYKGKETLEVIAVKRTDQNECFISINDITGETSIELSKEDLSDFIGILLHTQSLIKRNIRVRD